MSLLFSFDPVTFIQASVEPLRAIGYAHLGQDRIHQFLIENLCIFFRSKIVVTFAPNSPAISQAVSDLLCAGLAAKTTIRLRYAGFTEILLGKNIGSDLAPLFGHLYIVHFKYHLTIGITDHTGTVIIFKLVEHIYSIFRKATTKLQSPHGGSLFSVCHN